MCELIKAVRQIAGNLPRRAPNDIGRIRALIVLGAPLEAVDKDGLNAFFWAVNCGLLDIAEFLEDAGADTSSRGDAELIRACLIGDGELAQTGIANGADPESQHFRFTLLQFAMVVGAVEVVEVLIKAGIHVPLDALKVLVEEDITDWRCKVEGGEIRYARLIEIVLAQGASPAVSVRGMPLVEYFPEREYPMIRRVLTQALQKWISA